MEKSVKCVCVFIYSMWWVCDVPGPPECEMEQGGSGFTRVNIPLRSQPLSSVSPDTSSSLLPSLLLSPSLSLRLRFTPALYLSG